MLCGAGETLAHRRANPFLGKTTLGIGHHAADRLEGGIRLLWGKRAQLVHGAIAPDCAGYADRCFRTRLAALSPRMTCSADHRERRRGRAKDAEACIKGYDPDRNPDEWIAVHDVCR